MSDPALNADSIPSELVNLKAIYERRYLRRKEAFDDKQRELAKKLEPLIVAHRQAVHTYEDHFDDGLLKYGRDPNKLPFEERDPAEVKQARKLKRAIEDAELAVRTTEGDLAIQFKAIPEFAAFNAARTEFEDWLGKVCIYLKCCREDLDWNKRKVSPQNITAIVPTDLLRPPGD